MPTRERAAWREELVAAGSKLAFQRLCPASRCLICLCHLKNNGCVSIICDRVGVCVWTLLGFTLLLTSRRSTSAFLISLRRSSIDSLFEDLKAHRQLFLRTKERKCTCECGSVGVGIRQSSVDGEQFHLCPRCWRVTWSFRSKARLRYFRMSSTPGCRHCEIPLSCDSGDTSGVSVVRLRSAGVISAPTCLTKASGDSGAATTRPMENLADLSSMEAPSLRKATNFVLEGFDII